MKKKIILKLASFLSLFWKCIPFDIRKLFFTSFFIIESRGDKSKDGLKRVFLIKDKLEWIINERAIKYDNGCLLYTSPSPRDKRQSRMPSSA